MIRSLVLAFLTTILAIGCTTGSSKVIYKGEQWFSMSCRHMAECYAEANKVCPGGYKEEKEGARSHEILFTCTSGHVNWQP